MHADDGHQTTIRYRVLEADLQQLQEEKAQVDKQLIKAREESQMLSELIKDMEHKWTEMAKDYEKQVGNRSSVPSKFCFKSRFLSCRWTRFSAIFRMPKVS